MPAADNENEIGDEWDTDGEECNLRTAGLCEGQNRGSRHFISICFFQLAGPEGMLRWRPSPREISCVVAVASPQPWGVFGHTIARGAGISLTVDIQVQPFQPRSIWAKQRQQGARAEGWNQTASTRAPVSTGDLWQDSTCGHQATVS